MKSGDGGCVDRQLRGAGREESANLSLAIEGQRRRQGR